MAWEESGSSFRPSWQIWDRTHPNEKPGLTAYIGVNRVELHRHPAHEHRRLTLV